MIKNQIRTANNFADVTAKFDYYPDAVYDRISEIYDSWTAGDISKSKMNQLVKPYGTNADEVIIYKLANY